MKTSIFASLFKKALFFGLATLLVVSCGKSKNKVDSNAVTNQIGYGSPTQTNYVNTVKSQYQCNRVADLYFYVQGQTNGNALNGSLQQVGGFPQAGGNMYVGVDQGTGDVAVLTQVGGNWQLTLSLCHEQGVTDTQLTNFQMFQAFILNTNAGCQAGSLSAGTITFGNQYGFTNGSVFSPVQNCY